MRQCIGPDARNSIAEHLTCRSGLQTEARVHLPPPNFDYQERLLILAGPRLRLPISCGNLVQPAYLISKDVVFTCCHGADPISSYEVRSKPTIESEPTGTTCKSASTLNI